MSKTVWEATTSRRASSDQAQGEPFQAGSSLGAFLGSRPPGPQPPGRPLPLGWAHLIRLNLRAAWGRAYVRVIGANRELSWVFFEILLPILGTAAYVFIYRAMHAPPAYTGFVILGGAMTAYWTDVLWSMASQLYWEKESSNLEAFFIAPCSRMAILAGMAVGGAFRSTLRAAAILFLGSAIFGVRLPPANPLLLAGVFLLTLGALYGLGMTLASVYLVWGREAWHISTLLQEPVYLAVGLYFPVRALGGIGAGLASLIPLTLGLDAMRQLFYGAQAWGFLTVPAEMGLLAGQAILMLVLAKVSLDHMERLAKQEGRLTLKWQ